MSLEPPSECDLVVVGAGIVGLAVARELGRRHEGARIVVLEREDSIGAHQTSHSSGVIHAGVYYEPGSLKARLCVEGAAELYAYCESHGVEARRIGKLIVATADNELDGLAELERRASANGVPGLRRLDATGIREIEPHARGVAALHSAATGVVDFAHVAAAFATEIEGAGGAVVTSCQVAAVQGDDSIVTVRHGAGVTRARAVVACAGAWSDRLARGAGAPADPRIVPFRGGYLRLRAQRSQLVRANIYPVPDPELPFLGAHLTRGPDGTVLLGPTALMVGARDAYRPTRIRAADVRETLAWPGTRRLIARHWRAGATELLHAVSKRAYVRSARRLVPELRRGRLRRGPGRHPCPGPRGGRHAGRRFRRLAGRRGGLRPQRAIARGDLVSAPRAPDRRRGRRPARLTSATAILTAVQHPTEISLNRDGVALAGLDFGGAATPVLFLHGLAGYAGEWRTTTAWLTPRHRAIALDARGHGASERRPDDVSIDAHAADAAYAIEQLALDPIVVVGQSLGGLTAISLAANHRRLVSALVIVDADPAPGKDQTVTEVDEYLRRWPVPFASLLEAARYFGGSPGSAAAWANGLERRDGGWWPRFDFDVMTRTLSEALARDYWSEWQRIQCPVLIVRAGNGDVPLATAEEMTERLERSRLIEIPGAGHDIHLDRPDEWRAVLTGFLDAISPR